ncbi:heavy metal-binding domain-containing protein [Hymenobacter negativus]|uniref:Heavy metal binding domain-containing protein n=1 Tax=Hymenobacter negativus TaxID=2795026 RepID=A0ABS0QDH0_9BACT|nr:heavy metal-binding domain-containing protein [Hymenobacter negativus]MBH8560388.1 hypothetical protein [Hymenobacter negativus]
MNKFLPLGLALASLTFAASGCSDNKSTTETTTTTPAAETTMAPDSASTTTPDAMATTYTCSMHPEVVSDKPGKCPKCGMDLIVKK